MPSFMTGFAGLRRMRDPGAAHLEGARRPSGLFFTYHLHMQYV